MRTAAVVVLLLLAAAPAAGQATSEAGLKAAFLISFAKLGTWPHLAPAAPMTICAVGDEEVASVLASMVPTQRIEARRVTALRLGPNDAWTRCHILFLGRTVWPRLSKRILEDVPDAVLTVSDHERFASNGGMVEFFMEATRLRFTINLTAVHRSGVVLSARVLQLARIVGDEHVRVPSSR